MDVPKRRSKDYAAQMKRLVAEYNSNGKKTILLTCDAFFPVFDGVINVMDNYASRLKDTMNVLVLAPSFKGKVYCREYPVLGTVSFYSKKLFYQVALPQLDGRAKRILKQLRIDVIHAHSPFFVGRYALKLHKRRGIPLVTTFHSQYKMDFQKTVGSGALCRFMMRFIMKTFNGSDEVWTMNESVGNVLKSYGYHGRAFRYLPNATCLPLPDDYEGERARGRARYGVGDEPLFICVGRIVSQKNIYFVSEVLGVLKRLGFAFKMLFVGDGPDLAALKKSVKEQNIEEEVYFTGQVRDSALLCEIYSAADLLLFPSYYDTIGLVQVEAASRFTPTAFAANSVASCTVRNGVDGYVFPHEKEEFARRIIEVVESGTLHTVGERAMRDLYITWDDVVAQAKTYFMELIAAHEAGEPSPEAEKE